MQIYLLGKNTAPDPAFSEAGTTSQSHNNKGKGTGASSLSLNLGQKTCINLLITPGTDALQLLILATEKKGKFC